MLNPSAQHPPLPETTVPPKISTCWDTEADYQRMKTTWEMESGVISEMKSKWWRKQRKTHGTEKKNKSVKRTEWGNILHGISLNKKGERWQHFTCWRMKVFIVAKMRATLQKQHRDTTVTQPGTQLQPLTIVYRTVILQVIFLTSS